jgi:hypothetical protein
MRKNVKNLIQTVCDAAHVAAHEGRYAEAAAHCEHAARIYDMQYRMDGQARHSEAVRHMMASADRYHALAHY